MAKNKKELAAHVKRWRELCSKYPILRYFKHKQQLEVWMRANSIPEEEFPEDAWELHESVEELKHIASEKSHDKKEHAHTTHAPEHEKETEKVQEQEEPTAPEEQQETIPSGKESPPIPEEDPKDDQDSVPIKEVTIPKPIIPNEEEQGSPPKRGQSVDEALASAKNSAAKNLLMLHFRDAFTPKKIGEELHEKSKWDDQEYIKAIVKVETTFKKKYQFVDKKTGNILTEDELLERLDRPESYDARVSPDWNPELDKFTNEELADQDFAEQKEERIESILEEEKDTVYENPLEDPVLTLANEKYEELAKKLILEAREDPTNPQSEALNRATMEDPSAAYTIARTAVMTAFAEHFPKKAAAYSQLPTIKEGFVPIRNILTTLKQVYKPATSLGVFENTDEDVFIIPTQPPRQQRTANNSSLSPTRPQLPTTTPHIPSPAAKVHPSLMNRPAPPTTPQRPSKRQAKTPPINKDDSILDGLKSLQSPLSKLKSAVMFNPIAVVLIILFSAALYMLIFDSTSTSALDGGGGSSSGSDGSPGVGTPINPNIPGLTITIDGPNQVPNGTDITYTVNVIYNSSQALTPLSTIELVSSIPNGTTFKNVTTGTPLDPSSNPLIWPLSDSTNQGSFDVTFTPTSQDINVVFLISARIASGGGTGDLSSLLPASTISTPEIDQQQQAVAALIRSQQSLVAAYQAAQDVTGMPWQILAGIHYREGSLDPNRSLASGRPIGENEPDIVAGGGCLDTYSPGKPVALPGGGCGFRTFADSAIFAANHLRDKIGGIPTSFQDLAKALSKYNGGGNANCGEGVPYPHCPPDFYGDDDPYALNLFDQKHQQMYVIYCLDYTKCNPPRLDSNLGTLSVILALSKFY